MKPIIRVINVGKQYRIGAQREIHNNLREALVAGLRAPFKHLRNGQNSVETIWALQDVNFEVHPGEVLGIVGRNGAGKSTLLKILSRITKPTTGRVELYGRFGSLLEVGTGFHPELTGRENIFLNGAVLGMRRSEIATKFDEIVAFAEIDKFLDTPVKHYSSGMYMRLAFAVAAHLEPEILIVDEVLAVGDATFQRKCIGKMGEVAKTGRTVIFVSHNMTAVKGLCTQVAWLQQGRIIETGRTNEVTSKYSTISLSACAEQRWEDINSAPGNEQVAIRAARVTPTDGTSSDRINVHTPIVIEFEYWNHVPGAELNLSVVVSSQDGLAIFNTGPNNERVWHGKPFPAALFRSSFEIPGDLLNDGTHRVQLMVIRDQATMLYKFDDILIFDIEDSMESRGNWYGKWIGAVRPNLKWRTDLLALR